MESLNMVPMGMGHDVNLIAGRPVFRNEVAQLNAGSSIHDNRCPPPVSLRRWCYRRTELYRS